MATFVYEPFYGPTYYCSYSLLLAMCFLDFPLHVSVELSCSTFLPVL